MGPAPRAAGGLLLGLLLLASPAAGRGERYLGPLGEIPPWEPRPGVSLPSEERSLPAGVPPLLDSWPFAWHCMENGILEEEAASRNPLPGPAASSTPSARDVEERILPVLRRAILDPALAPRDRAAVLLALARRGDRASAPLLREFAHPRWAVGEEGEALASAALLGLGLLDDPGPESPALLRESAGRAGMPTLLRSFACVGLALRGRGRPDRESLAVLEGVLLEGTDDPGAPVEVAAAAAFALGRSGDPEASPLLRRRLAFRWRWRDRRDHPGLEAREDLLRAHAAAALGRAAAAADAGEQERALEALSREAKSGRSLPLLGAVVGLGRLGEGGGEEAAEGCLERLEKVLRGPGTDARAARQGILAVGRIGSRPEGRAGREARDLLLRALETGRPDPGWTVLAVGFAGRGAAPADRALLAGVVRERLAVLLGAGPGKCATCAPHPFRREEAPACIALGLLGDAGSPELLRKVLGDRGRGTATRGAAALGLGLLGDRASVPELLRTLRDGSERGHRREAALALGLLGAGEGAELLPGAIEGHRPHPALEAALTQAAGWTGGGDGYEYLVFAAEDRDRPLLRAASLQALGRITFRGRPDPLAPLADDALLGAWTGPLLELWRLL